MITINDFAKPSANEVLKYGKPLLAGTITPTLADPQADHFCEDDTQFLKFHGIYQQDDRDARKTGKRYFMMIRGRIPGGVLTPAQYLALDGLSRQYANDTLRITSRQSIQLHCVLKSNLARTIKGINDTLLTTVAACGDVVRNVMAPSAPATDAVRRLILEEARKLSLALAPVTPAYHEIWLEGKELNLATEREAAFSDPLYGKLYLPRKFKIAFAIPPVNDVDVFTSCVGLIAIVQDGQLAGFNLTAGGGMGRSHGNAETFPRLADVVGFITSDQVQKAITAAVTIHRDFGDRSNRKHARLKYVLADHGVDWFRAELEQRTGFKLAPARPFNFTEQGDRFGWHQQEDGQWFLGLFVETGRIRDTLTRKFKTALRQIVEQFQPEIRLTPANNLLLVSVQEDQRDKITKILAGFGISVEHQVSAVRSASMACVAFPTCGLALAEAERYLPNLMTGIEQLLAELGLADQEIIIRMTGCPNGCARPYMAEIGFVGKAPGKYQIYLGGNEMSTRLNRLYKDTVKDTDLINELRPLLQRFVRERIGAERFGAWVERVFWNESAAVNPAPQPGTPTPAISK